MYKRQAFDLDVLAQVHDNRCWLGLRLNDAPLSDDGEGRRSRGLGARHAAAREQRPKRPPLALTALLKSGDPADVRTAVAPLWRAPYAEQLSAKREALKRALDDLGVAAPPLEPFDAFFADAGASQPRNKLEFHVGADGVVGFRAGDAVLAPDGVPFAPYDLAELAAFLNRLSFRMHWELGDAGEPLGPRELGSTAATAGIVSSRPSPGPTTSAVSAGNHLLTASACRSCAAACDSPSRSTSTPASNSTGAIAATSCCRSASS